MSSLASLARAAKAGWFPGLVFAAHCVLSLGFHAYDRFVWLDVVMHLLGGVAIAYFFDALVANLDQLGVLRLGDRRTTLVMVFGLVAVAALGWEFAEFAADALFSAGAQRSLANTMKDQFMGLTGGLVYVGFFIPRAYGKPLLIVGVLSSMILAAAGAVAVVGRDHVYRGPMDEPAVWDPRVPPARVVEEARKLVGIWYDPAQGYLNDIGGKLGMIVCMDVPRLAYREGVDQPHRLGDRRGEGRPLQRGRGLARRLVRHPRARRRPDARPGLDLPRFRTPTTHYDIGRRRFPLIGATIPGCGKSLKLLGRPWSPASHEILGLQPSREEGRRPL